MMVHGHRQERFGASLEKGNLLLVLVSISLGSKTSHFLIEGQHKQSLSDPSKLELLDEKKGKVTGNIHQLYNHKLFLKT